MIQHFIKRVAEEFFELSDPNAGKTWMTLISKDIVKSFLAQKLQEAYELGVKEGYDEEIKRQHLRIVQV